MWVVRCGEWRGPVRATVRGVRSPCNLTFSAAGWQKIVAQIRGVFRKIITHPPPGGRILAQNHVFTPIFCLHTVTKVCGYRPFGYFLRPFHLLIEIYPLVPFPPSVRERVSDYTRTSLQWTPLTVARTGGRMGLELHGREAIKRTSLIPTDQNVDCRLRRLQETSPDLCIANETPSPQPKANWPNSADT